MTANIPNYSYRQIFQLIEQFKKISTPDAISPESLGNLLELIHAYPQEVVYNHDDLWEVINDLKKDLDTEVTNRQSGDNNLEAKINEVVQKLTPPALLVSELDSFGTDGTPTAMYNLLKDSPHTRWRVVAKAGQDMVTVGLLDVFMDSSKHVITQILTTHYDFNNKGELEASAHRDDEVRRYFRSFNLSSTVLTSEGTAIYTWSKWRSVTADIVESLDDAWATISDLQHDVTQEISDRKAGDEACRDYTDLSCQTLDRKIDTVQALLEKDVEDTYDSLKQDLDESMSNANKRIDGALELIADCADAEETDAKFNEVNNNIDNLNQEHEADIESLDQKIDTVQGLLEKDIADGDSEVKSELNKRIDSLVVSVAGSHSGSSKDLGRLEVWPFKVVIPDNIDIMNFPSSSVQKYELQEGDIVWSEKYNGFACWNGENFSADWGEIINETSEEMKAPANSEEAGKTGGLIDLTETAKFNEAEYYGDVYPGGAVRTCRRPMRKALYHLTSDHSLWLWDGTTLRKMTDLEALRTLTTRLETLIGNGDVSAVIDTFNEIEAFLQGITNTETLTGLLADLKAEILADTLKNYQPKGNYLTEHQSLDALLKKDGSNGTAAGVSALINKLSTGDSVPSDNAYFITQYADGSQSSYHRRPFSTIWDYIKGKGGSGSGLDADKLDGKHANELQVAEAIRLQAITLTNEDLNDIKDINFTQYYAVSGNSTKNRPQGFDGYGLHVYATSPNYICQEAFNAGQASVKRRFWANGTWSAWKNMLMEGNTATAAKELKDSQGTYLTREKLSELKELVNDNEATVNDLSIDVWKIKKYTGFNGRPPQQFIDEFIAATNIESVRIYYYTSGTFTTRASVIAEPAVYNEDTGYFEWNGLTDITYQDAKDILKEQLLLMAEANLKFYPRKARTLNVYAHTVYGELGTIHKNFEGDEKIEVIRFVNNSFQPNLYPYFYGDFLNGCTNLHTIIGELSFVNGSSYQCQVPTFCTPNLREIRFKGCNGLFRQCSKLSFDSCKYFIENSTSGTFFYVHPDVYAKFYGDMNNIEVTKLTASKLQAWMTLAQQAIDNGIVIVNPNNN